jgi:hypothetical protein
MRTIAGKTLGVALGVLVVAVLTGATTGISTQQVRTAAPGVVNVSGVTAAEGSSLAVCRADHTHSLSGTLPQANGGTGAGALTCSAGQHLTSNGAAYSCSSDSWNPVPPTATTLGAVMGTGTVMICPSPQVARGFNVLGQLQCSQPSDVTGGAATAASANAVAGAVVSLTSNVTGTLPVANGGTGDSPTPTAGGAVYANGTVLAVTAAGTSGQVLTSNGAAAPTWAAAGAAAAGGNTLQFQYNQGGTLSGSAGLSWDRSSTSSHPAGRIDVASHVVIGPPGGAAGGGLIFSPVSTHAAGDIWTVFKDAALSSYALRLDYLGNLTATSFVGPLTGNATTATTAASANAINGAVVSVANHSATGTPSATTYLRGDNTWSTPAGGGGSPAGTNTMVQFNNSGAFGGSSALTFVSATNALATTGTVTAALGFYGSLYGNATSAGFMPTLASAGGSCVGLSGYFGLDILGTPPNQKWLYCNGTIWSSAAATTAGSTTTVLPTTGEILGGACSPPGKMITNSNSTVDNSVWICKSTVWSLPDAASIITGGVIATNGIPYFNTPSTLGSTALGVTGMVLHSNSAGAPTWSAVGLTDEVAGILPVLNGGTGNASGTVAALSTAGAANQFWANGNTWAQPSFTNISGTASTGQIPALPYLPVGDAAASANAINGAVVSVANHSATGTPSATTYYRGDNTWATPAGAGTLTRPTAAWASSATANTTGIIGTAGVPMTSPTYAAAAPFSFRCIISTNRPSTTNGPRYGVAASAGSVTRISATYRIGLAATTRTETKSAVAMTTNCAAGCSTAMTTGTLAGVIDDEIDGTGVMNASGTISVYMAPSAAGANTAQIGSYCIWY